MELAGKVVVVTGGASGIGEALCRRFADEHAERVVVADRDARGAERVAESIGEAALGLAVDVTDETQVAELVQFALDDAALLSGGPDDDRTLHVDLGWLELAGPPFAAAPAPDLVALAWPGPDAAALAPWLRWLDAGRPLVPTGPATWVAVVDPAFVGEADVEQGLARGRVAAGNGPLVQIAVDGTGPGDQVPPPVPHTGDTAVLTGTFLPPLVPRETADTATPTDATDTTDTTNTDTADTADTAAPPRRPCGKSPSPSPPSRASITSSC